MQFSTVLLTAVASLLSGAAAQNILKAQYYSDSDCKNYLTEINLGSDFVTSSTGGCFSYGFGGTTSGNIASCTNGACWCYFYESSDCSGNFVGFAQSNHQTNCAQGNWGSVRCGTGSS